MPDIERRFEWCVAAEAFDEILSQRAAAIAAEDDDAEDDAQERLWALILQMVDLPASSPNALGLKARAVRIAFESELAGNAAAVRLLCGLLRDLERIGPFSPTEDV